MKPFEGLKVIELTAVLAGPAVGMFFAELGATVIKVENMTTGGDMTRRWKLPQEKDSPISAYFSAVNYNKSYVDLNLKSDSGKSDLLDLLEDADILINNMKRSSAIKFGVDYKSLSVKFPELIYCELSGFKLDENKVAFDAVLQAETGYISMTGSPGSPAKLPVAFIDVMAAHQMKEAILIALIERMNDGRGSYIQCSLEESALASLSNQASNQLMEGFTAEPMGTLHPNIAPYGEIVQSKDGQSFMLAIGTDLHFKKLCDILNCRHLLEDHRFSSNQNRLNNREPLFNILLKQSKALSSTEFRTAYLEAGIPIGEVKDLNTVMRSAVAQGMRRDEMIQGVETSRLSSIAFQITRPS